MDNKKTIIVSVAAIIALILITAGATFAFFSAQITGIESASTLSLSGATLTINYSEGTGVISVSNIYPRGSASSPKEADAWITKTINLVGKNTSDKNMPYTLGFHVDTNGFGSYLTYTLTNTAVANGTAATGNLSGTIGAANSNISFTGGKFTNTGNSTATHTYVFRIFFFDSGSAQNDAQGKSFTGHFTLSSSQLN